MAPPLLEIAKLAPTSISPNVIVVPAETVRPWLTSPETVIAFASLIRTFADESIATTLKLFAVFSKIVSAAMSSVTVPAEAIAAFCVSVPDSSAIAKSPDTVIPALLELDPITIAVFAERSTSCAEISLIVILLPDNFCKSTEIFPEPETRLLIVLDFITKLSDVVPMPPPAVSEIDPRVSIFAVSTEATEPLSPSVIFPAVETVTPPEVVTRLLPS